MLGEEISDLSHLTTEPPGELLDPREERQERSAELQEQSGELKRRIELAAKNGLVPGTYSVMIFSPNDEGEQVAMEGAPGPGIMVSPELIPSRYNTETELEVEVSADGENSFTFELTSETSP